MTLEPARTGDWAARVFGQSPTAALALLRACWPLAVGRDLAQRTEVVALEGRTLRIKVPDARWRKVLHRMQREIVVRLREAAGALAPTRLSFSEGAVASAEPSEAASEAARAAPRPLPADVAERAEAIADPEIREQFLSAAARYLSRFGADHPR